MEAATAAPVSTATPVAPQPAPEAQAATPQATPAPKLSLREQAEVRLKEFREQNGKPEVQPATEEPATEAKTETPTEETPVTEDAGPLEVISHNGKEAKIADVLGDATFEVFANGEMRPIEGIEKLMDMASIGYAAAEKNAIAKDAVIKAQDVIREIEASKPKEIQAGVTAYLNDLLDQVTNGRVNPATNKPFQSQTERAGAVELASELVRANEANNAKPNQSQLTREEIEKLVEEKADKKLKETETKRQEQQRKEVITKTASEVLQKETKPLMQHFLKEDGQTLNRTLYSAFIRDVQVQADKYFNEAKAPNDPAKISEFVKKATQTVFGEYKPSLRAAAKQAEVPKAPVLGTKSGMPQGNPNAKPPKFKSYDQSVKWHLDQFRQQKTARAV